LISPHRVRLGQIGFHYLSVRPLLPRPRNLVIPSGGFRYRISMVSVRASRGDNVHYLTR
jgi:hypothetical protein